MLPSSPFIEGDLRKLTVPQLKLLCKEKRIAGYSKLPKDSIIAKLLEWQKKHSPPGLQECVSSLDSPTLLSSPVASVSVPIKPAQSISHPNSTESFTSRADAPVLDIPINRADNAVVSKRPRPKPEALPNHHLDKKRIKVVTDTLSETTSSSTPVLRTPLTCTVMTVVPIQAEKRTRPEVISVYPPKQQCNSPIEGPAKPVARRFQALLPIRNVGQKSAANILDKPPAARILPTASRTAQSLQCYLSHSGLLDFAPENAISLKNITFPPTLAQRKHIPRLSLVMSGISFEDLKICALVSRSFRYAAYLSAFHQLTRRFPGRRLGDVLRRYPQKLINLWPYLHLREQEVQIRRGLYEASFLCGVSTRLFDIDELLWSSPAHEKQATIAVRFLITKLFFLMSVGRSGDESRQTKGPGTVLDAEEVIEDEIWKITYRSSSSIQTFYVIESTCEVIGNAGSSADASTPPLTNLRADWAAYIQCKQGFQSRTIGGERLGLLEHLQWSNHEEYNRGISKIWSERTKGEGMLGRAKLIVAQRYVMACVIGNSVSGPWRTSNQMAQEFDGYPAMSSHLSREPKTQRINLFLPAHHHVESVHFLSTNGQILHPAIAVVQTPGREYFILRDNGMQVGCEEEGIASVWLDILGCKQNGCL